MSSLFPSKKAQTFFLLSAPFVAPILAFLLFYILSLTNQYGFTAGRWDGWDEFGRRTGGPFWKLFGFMLHRPAHDAIWLAVIFLSPIPWLFFTRFIFRKDSDSPNG